MRKNKTMAFILAGLLLCSTAGLANGLADADAAAPSHAFSTAPAITPDRAPASSPQSSDYEISYDTDLPGSKFSFILEDRYFEGDARHENLPLAQAAMALSSTVYTKDKTLQALQTLGFCDPWAVDYDKTAKPGDNNFVGLVIARKTILTQKEPIHLFALVFRGTLGLEWLSNFNLGREESQTSHLGFSLAADRAFSALQIYYDACLAAGVIDGDISHNALWLMGHSRGGAVCNLLAACLNRTEHIARQDKIFAFTFAAPNVSRSSGDHRAGFQNIRNYVNPRDLITRIPLSRKGWRYRRFGQDIYLSFRMEQQVAQRYDHYSQLPYRPFSYLTLEIILAALHKVAPTWQDYYGLQTTYDKVEENAYTLAAAFEIFSYILANIPREDSPQAYAASDDPIGQLLQMIFPDDKPPTELEHGHSYATYFLFLQILAEQSND